MTPEVLARQAIDAMLVRSGWIVQDRAGMDLNAGLGVAVRELPTSAGPADYMLFLDRRACGVLEAKPAGTTLLGVGPQAAGYAAAAPAAYLAWANPLPLYYLSNGEETLLRDGGDPLPVPRPVFAVHRPETLRAMLQAPGGRLRARLRAMPPLDPGTLRVCQTEAIGGVEASLAAGRPRALVQMATGAGKTYTACALAHRLLTHARMGRILFLVDRANLGDQTLVEFKGYKPPGGDLTFAEEYVVQHLRGQAFDPGAQVVISTIQRLYAALRGEALDDGADERSGFEAPNTALRPVAYSPALPPEAFDLVIVDECHRSIYGAWRQVLDYFDAFTVGLTATPGKHTLGYFGQNMVSEYPFERSVADGVNVPFEVFRIRTEIGEHGATIPAGFTVPRRDRATRARRWDTLDEDLAYAAAQLNRTVEAQNQIRTVLQAYRDALPTQLFAGRTEVPKTLVFCRDESHAETVTALAREVLGLDDRGVQKITYRSGDGQALIKAFRADWQFRVAVTVDMVATGTDLRPLEAVMFLRDVRSRQYFQQMLGRGARSVGDAELRRVTPSAKLKDRFVVVDAVGVTEGGQVDAEPLDRDRAATLKGLLDRAAACHEDEDLCTTLAARLARLHRRLDAPAAARVAATGADLPALARALVDAADPAVIEARAVADYGGDMDAAAAELRRAALLPLQSKPALRLAILEEAARSEMVVDELTPDRVLTAGLDQGRAEAVVAGFRGFLDAKRDELDALALLHGRPARSRRLTYAALLELRDAMARPPWLLDSADVWRCYRRLRAADVRDPGPVRLATDLVALVRFALGRAPVLEPASVDVARRFNLWLGREERAGRTYTPAQRAWLDLMRDAVAANGEVASSAFRDDPAMDRRGGLRAARAALGAERLPGLLEELSATLMPVRPEDEAA